VRPKGQKWPGCGVGMRPKGHEWPACAVGCGQKGRARMAGETGRRGPFGHKWPDFRGVRWGAGLWNTPPVEKNISQFPEGFLWGAAVSAHQVEGGNVNSDWWWWEHLEATPVHEPSGDACDFYHRYGEDIARLAAAGRNAFRFSIEWARIEPAEGEFSRAALGPY